ncbi:MAG TPA: hypothetical protein VIJ77_01965 [Candidatus Tumulicola sp.]
MIAFAGFDHIDCRVRSLATVESFYDALMAELGLPRKRRSYVDEAGEWHDVSAGGAYNTIEFYEEERPDRATFFIGFIERHDHVPAMTRIAFRVDSSRMFELESLLPRLGARNLERSENLGAYPAIFFEDPAGTRLEIVARTARPS